MNGDGLRDLIYVHGYPLFNGCLARSAGGFAELKEVAQRLLFHLCPAMRFESRWDYGPGSK
jgi:hypothetical protein